MSGPEMTMPDASERFVSLRGGLVVPYEPLLIALDLEARGFHMRPDGGDLIISPFSQLTAEDRQQIRRWKYHLAAIVCYEAPECA